MAKITSSYRIRRRSNNGSYEYNNGGMWRSARTGWSSKGKIFFGRGEIRKYLELFVGEHEGNLCFSWVEDWEIVEVAGEVTKPQDFFHTWEHLSGQMFKKESKA